MSVLKILYQGMNLLKCIKLVKTMWVLKDFVNQPVIFSNKFMQI